MKALAEYWPRVAGRPDLGQLPRPEAEPLSIGIVVPVYNEAAILKGVLPRLAEVARRVPVVVVDGGSTDNSVRIARRFFHTEMYGRASRGRQLNHGARCLLTDVLLFLHADSQLPAGFEYYIRRALGDPLVVGGCFQLQFDDPHPLLRFYSWFTRFPGRFFHFGDQAFFVRWEAFWRLGGFRALPFLEDVDFLRRLGRRGRFAVLPVSVVTSARRFRENGVLWQQLVNIGIVALFELGVSAERLVRLYPHTR